MAYFYISILISRTRASCIYTDRVDSTPVADRMPHFPRFNLQCDGSARVNFGPPRPSCQYFPRHIRFRYPRRYMVNARIGLETGSREVQLWSVGATERHKGAKSRWKQLYRQFKPQSLSSLREREKERVERERIEIGERSFYPCKPNCGYYSVGGSFCSSIVNLPFRGTLRVLVPHLVQRCRGYRG